MGGRKGKEGRGGMAKGKGGKKKRGAGREERTCSCMHMNEDEFQTLTHSRG